MKTNHQRNFTESKKCRHNTVMHMIRGSFSRRTEVGEPMIIMGKHPGWDHSNGHRGTANAKRGYKKFIRTRLRFNENQGLRSLLKELK